MEVSTLILLMLVAAAEVLSFAAEWFADWLDGMFS